MGSQISLLLPQEQESLHFLKHSGAGMGSQISLLLPQEQESVHFLKHSSVEMGSQIFSFITSRAIVVAFSEALQRGDG
ncbi:MAG: hypothetical protein F6K40_26585 [Okeania sp. SIO3I5]|uniref:hypothetical protein n=2 Tax=Okeania sp. SIO3I5 TaxID=2607805 RepID=UPI0013BCEBB4|nr:hypothetical protein [Okeania sp. SIO3I5]NEQ39628.1 hypothetical protein [Okeania sp. SIO3I5]